jgi:hypothetical protein
MAYNEAHGITPKTIWRSHEEIMEQTSIADRMAKPTKSYGLKPEEHLQVADPLLQYMSKKELNKQLIEVNLLIKKEKIINRKLKHKLGLVEKKNNATTELISDYDLMYNINYLRNFGLFICILISGYAISKIKNNN